MFLPCKQKITYYNRDSWSFSSQDANLTKVITWGSKFVIYDIFNCDVSFPLLYHCARWQCNVINVNNFREILRCLFQILASPVIEENKVLGEPFVILSHRQIHTNTSEIQNPVLSIRLKSDFELSLLSGDHTEHLTNASISFSQIICWRKVKT